VMVRNDEVKPSTTTPTQTMAHCKLCSGLCGGAHEIEPHLGEWLTVDSKVHANAQPILAKLALRMQRAKVGFVK
jgi:hypothetical protein